MMADRRLSNVLPFEPPGVSTVASLSPDAAHLLTLCRDSLAHGVATAFAGNLGNASDDLLGMADRATSLEQQQLYFAALEILANRGQALLQQFRAAYVTHFDASLAALHRGRRLEHPAELGELSLIDTEDFERDLAVDKLSARAACNCANQLTALERRLAALLHLPRVSQDENPLYPRALFTAMLGALNGLGVTEQLALTLLQEFERQTSVELPGIYNELNRELVDGGILPKIPVGLARPARRSEVDEPAPERDSQDARDPGQPLEPGRQIQADWACGDALSAVTDSGAAGPSLPYGGEDVFALLARAIQANGGAGVGAMAGVPSGPLPGSFPAAPVPAGPMAYGATPAGAPGAMLGVTQLIQALTSLQRGRADTRDLPGLGSIQIDPAGGQVLRQLRSTPMASWSHPTDALTIDIVALLFDAIFKDADLSAALRAEIAKLQIPVLKVALMDKTFFSNARDPARRLLDGIAGAGIGRDPSEEGRIADKVRAIVDEVVAGFDTDLDIFDRQVKALEDFLQEEESRARSRTSEMVVELEERDRRELARTRVEEEIANRLRQRTVPTLVADFLNRHWSLVLLQAYLQSGEQGEPWGQAVTTMEDLVWSVGPKRRADDRGRLLTTLPGLLKRLRAGLAAAGANDAWDPFFAQLIRLHVAALRNEIQNPAPQAAPSEPREAQRPSAPTTANLRDFRTLAQIDAVAGSPSRSQETPGAAANPIPHPLPNAAADRHLQLAQSLNVGAWVELESDRGTRKTLRLSWVSELRGVYLFTNRQGENALTLAATSLADHLRKGTARVLSQDRITDRAVAQLLGNAEPAK
jgi:hypothetical protein